MRSPSFATIGACRKARFSGNRRGRVAKERALATLRASPYAAAKIVSSEADIDPDARTAELSIELESGPAFRFGDIEITGLTKYPPSIVRNYSPIEPGDPYSEAALEHFIRRLNSTGYFSSVQATIDPATTHPEDAPVQVAVVEAPTKSFEGGIGYSTDVRYTRESQLSRRQHRRQRTAVAGRRTIDGNIQGGRCASCSRRTQRDGSAPGRSARSAPTSRASSTQTASAGTRWYTLDERRQRALSATYYLDDQ